MEERKRNWAWAALLGVLVLLGGALTYMHFELVSLGSLWTLVTAGEVHELDDTPAPVEPHAPRVLVFAMDGVGRDAFDALLEDPSSSASQLFGAREAPGVHVRGCVLDDALSVLPSTTIAAWTSVMTGQPVGQHGVPGNEWFIREERRFMAPAPVSVNGQDHTLAALTDALLDDHVAVPTVLERIEGRTHVSLLPVYRGADLFTVPDADALSALFAEVASGVLENESVSEAAYEHADEESVESVLEALAQHGVPAFQLVYLPGADLFAHQAGQPLPDQRDYLGDVTFGAIDQVLDRYRTEGVLADTTVIFISDHGHTPVMNDDRHALGVGEEDEPTAVLESVGFTVRGPALEETSSTFSAVVAYQGAMAYVYLADRSTCDGETPCDWSRPPRFDEDVLPVARAFESAGRGEGVTGGLEGALELVLTRPPRPTDEDAEAFQVLSSGELRSVERWLQAAPRPELLRLEARLEALSSGPMGHRAGDVALVARSGLELPIEQRFYFSNPYRSWHGGPTASDSRVTFAVTRANTTGQALCRELRSVTGPEPSQRHLTPLVQRLLTPSAGGPQ